MDQRDDQPVDEHQPMPGTGTRLTFPGPAASPVTTTLGHGLPRFGQLLCQASQMLPGDTGEQLMREDIPADHDHHGLDHPTLARSPFNRNHAPARCCSLRNGVAVPTGDLRRSEREARQPGASGRCSFSGSRNLRKRWAA
ncbi:hypothetical protein GL259_02310 [Streptomyces sp. Tu 3180]|nr:hypothetical protein GL259_02310 [Streptomyces sp. Tu 3180]